MNSVIVTGGAGFIGSALVRALLASGVERVVTLDRLTYAGTLDNLAELASDPRHVFAKLDIADGEGVSALLRTYAPRAVLHLAAESHVDRSIDAPATFAVTNTLGTVHLLDRVLAWWRTLPSGAQSAFRFVHVSTDEVYGSLGPSGAFTEASPYAPNSPYAASKAAADHFVRAFHRTYGLPVVTTNCCNNYGPRQHPEKLLPRMILRALHGGALPVYGDGANVREWLWVEDHCAGLIAALERGRVGEVYAFGGGEERTTLEVVHAVCDAVCELADPETPPRDRVRLVSDRPGHDRRYALDSSRARAELGWAPRVRFADGLRRTVTWYLANPEWVARVSGGA